jgi:hypothetical protein
MIFCDSIICNCLSVINKLFGISRRGVNLHCLDAESFLGIHWFLLLCPRRCHICSTKKCFEYLFRVYLWLLISKIFLFRLLLEWMMRIIWFKLLFWSFFKQIRFVLLTFILFLMLFLRLWFLRVKKLNNFLIFFN